ncbi:Tectonin beta-propeller repeat-containing protein 2 [Larimichthys crocea]|uniref:Tectonin beta-propeller repeat-containing protein 2 n=1 Tax=Larimichthys crocea TaxID=215358 RepID=A0A6G0HDU1_LARCR|nr:Tectonin beta-propeller repeat-containing protein 2 [Larimichthys crocea]
MEQLCQPSSLVTSNSRSRSSSVTSWDSLHGNASVTTSCELSSRRYSAPLGQGEELVVKAIRVRRRRDDDRTDRLMSPVSLSSDSSSGTRLSESSCSDSMFVVQDGSCSDGGSGTPQSDRASLIGMDLQNQDSPEPEQEQEPQEMGGLNRGVKAPSCLQAAFCSKSGEPTEPRKGSGPCPDAEVVPPTPDVDLLLECTFSYMHNTEEEEGQEHQPMEEQEDEFLSPLIGPEEKEEEEDEELAPPTGPVDHMFYSTVSSLDRKPSLSSDEDGDIYRHTPPPAGCGGDVLNHLTNQTDKTTHAQVDQDAQDRDTHKPDQLAESWMGYSGPGCGILSLQVTDRFVWCLDFKGGLFCSTLPETGLNWQRFEDNVHQVAVSPSGNLLWKVEQKSLTAFACAKVSVKGKRHWYKAVEQTAFVALSDDSAWIIRTNGDLYLQTGLSVDRPCARSVRVDTPCVFSQKGLDRYCSEGEGWKYDTVSEAQGLDLMCVALGDGGTVGTGRQWQLWFRTGLSSSRPQGDDDHWWQIVSRTTWFRSGQSVPDSASGHTECCHGNQGARERVVAFLSQYSQCQPSLVSANTSGVWVASGRNQLHLARGSLVGTFWQNVVPRGTVSATRWTFITSSAVPHREGTFLWLAQSRKDLFCVWDQDGELRPSSVPLPPEVELTHLSACRDALWGLDTHGRVSIRTLSPSCPIGLHWTLLDLSQLGSVRLVSVSCGSQNVWAVDSRGVVYFRVGTQPLNPSMMLPAWIHIEPPVQPIGVQLVIFRRVLMIICSGRWTTEEVSSSGLDSVTRCLWGRTGSWSQGWRNAAGDYWKKIPGTANWLTVTPEDELWAVTLIGGLSRRLTKPLPQTPCRPAPSGPSPRGDDVDDEWVLI